MKDTKWNLLINYGNVNTSPRKASVLLNKAKDLSVHHRTKVSHPPNNLKIPYNHGFIQIEHRGYKTSLVSRRLAPKENKVYPLLSPFLVFSFYPF